MKRRKKITLWIVGVLLSPVILSVILGILLYVPPVQQWAVNEISQIASKQTGWDISLERVRLKFLFSLDMQNISVTNPDVMLTVDHLVVDLGFSKLPKAKIIVKAVEVKNCNVDTQDLITSVRIKGCIGDFLLRADEVDLRRQTVDLTQASLTLSDIDIEMQDTTVIDTTESEPVKWVINLGDIAVRESRLAFHMPGDTMSVRTSIDSLVVTGGALYLENGVYTVGRAELGANFLAYDMNYEPETAGFDYNHIALSDINLDLSDIYYSEDSLSLFLSDGRAAEKSGLRLNELKSHFTMLDKGMYLPDIQLLTGASKAEGAVSLEWQALEPGGKGQMNAALSATVGKSDIALFVPDVAPMLPDQPIILEAEVGGNVDEMDIRTCRLLIDNMMEAEAEGAAYNVLDMDRLSFSIDLTADTYDLSVVNQMADLGDAVCLPDMHIEGNAALFEGVYMADLNIRQDEGQAAVKASYNTKADAYSAKLDINRLQLDHFLPGDSLHTLTARAEVTGRGMDVFSKSMQLTANLEVETFGYGPNDLGNMSLKAKLQNGMGTVDFYADNELLVAQSCIEAELSHTTTLAGFSLDVNHIDFYELGLVDKPFAASMLLEIDGNSNLKDTYVVEGSVKAIEFVLPDTILHPLDMSLSAGVLPDTIYAVADAGDLELAVSSCQGLDSLLNKCDRLVAELERQFDNFEIDQLRLMNLLPSVSARLNCGSRNPIFNILYATSGYSFDTIALDLESDSSRGLYAKGGVLGFNTGAILLDTIRLDAFQDTLGVVNMNLHVENNKQNKEVTFSTDLNTKLMPTGVSADIIFHDSQGQKGVEIGTTVSVDHNSVRMHLQPENPVVAYRNFTLNNDNYISLDKQQHLEANVNLRCDDGTGLALFTTENADALYDITLSVDSFNLGELSSVLPYLPEIKGLLDGDVHLVQGEKDMSITGDISVDELAYEGAPLGNIGANLLYLPNADGSHYVDAVLTLEGNEILLLDGTYIDSDGGSIDAKATMQQLPLSLANGFVPDGMAGLNGYMEAAMTVKGPLSAPAINGFICTDSMHVYSDMYSVNLSFPDDTLIIKDNYINLNKIEAYSSGDTPIVVDGYVDFHDFSNIAMDLSLDATEFELINAPKTRQAVAYGKVFADVHAKMTGTLNDIKVRGSLSVLGNTDVTYVLSDSPLSESDDLDELVTFIDFNEPIVIDSAQVAAPQNMDIEMALTIEQTAQVHCLLSTDGSNYIDIEGGGDFTMTYNMLDGLNLFGRYEVISGVMNYSIMVLALKDCVIQNGSYVEFNGNVLNPRLNIAASEKVKATVTEDNVPRTVTFDVGVVITQTMENMGLEFTLEAPEDLTVSNQLATLTAEGRSKAAVTLIVTGMYIADDGSGGGFSASNALNSFLQSQISSISNKALSTIDLTFGMDSSTTETGASQTDYSFSFAKHFWGNRISVIIGGKVSSGEEAQNNGQSIINNVSLEYRLDRSGTRYVRVYYDKETESVMEGEITEMGAGIVFRRKSNKLGELFIFKKDKK